MVLADDSKISEEDLPTEIKQAKASISNFLFALPESGIDLEEIEKEIIYQALEKNNWNQTHTAKHLNVSRNTLIYRMQKFNLTS